MAELRSWRWHLDVSPKVASTNQILIRRRKTKTCVFFPFEILETLDQNLPDNGSNLPFNTICTKFCRLSASWDSASLYRSHDLIPPSLSLTKHIWRHNLIVKKNSRTQDQLIHNTMLTLRKKAVQTAERVPTATRKVSRPYSSGQHGKTGDEVHHFAGSSTEHGHHSAGPKNESLGVSILHGKI